MTLEQAEKILDECHEYIGVTNPDSMCLDGWFTIPQLEAIIAIMRHAEGKPESEVSK